jgi:PIN domain nuclease of toxin-antitoxin system
VNLLLDSHGLVRFAGDDPRLSRAARDAIMDPNVQVLVSVASLWELSIKSALGRLRLSASPEAMVLTYGFALLPIEVAHVRRLRTLPAHHGDPFDRMLVAQAVEEGLTLVTADKALHRYPVAWLW